MNKSYREKDKFQCFLEKLFSGQVDQILICSALISLNILNSILHRYLGSVIFVFKDTLTTTLNHKTCINTSGQGLEKERPYWLSIATFTKDNNFSKMKVVGGSLQKTIPTCSKCLRNLILTYLQ